HGRPILSAIIGRVPKQAHEYVKNNPLIIQLQSDLLGTSQLDNADFQDGFDSLEEIGVEYIVLHLDRMSLEDTEKLEMWFQRFGAEEVYRDNALVALRIGRGV
ncbi:MAG: hypothetical protein KC940_07235, partial [Candidatus Omnitrophica bacterium]|nr:hypothetical protein [Candidatus Omnitrophota bacterium]